MQNIIIFVTEQTEVRIILFGQKPPYVFIHLNRLKINKVNVKFDLKSKFWLFVVQIHKKKKHCISIIFFIFPFGN